MKKVCVIFGAGDYTGTEVYKGDWEGNLIIAADGGMLQLERLGIVPGLLIGDFDSMEERQGENIIRHPVIKDDTDTLLAVREGLRQGCSRFIIYGGMGGRTDHTIANLQTLSFLAEQKAEGYMRGNGEVITVIKNGGLIFDKTYEGIISVFSMSDKSTGITIRGLKYEVDNISLNRSMPLGVSNEFMGKTARIEVKNGSLLVLWHDNGKLPEKIELKED